LEVSFALEAVGLPEDEVRHHYLNLRLLLLDPLLDLDLVNLPDVL